VIQVGKNNKQNDYLTHQLASSTDTWLHTKEIPGSHVVIRSKQVSEQTLLEAAMLAAYFSKGRESSQVPVDYTLIKYVKKPSGARPGFVTYENQKTLYVTPDEEEVKRILERPAD
jgi:predicted ribosome quality control (RQC) complex YloA/Tae2 family protein